VDLTRELAATGPLRGVAISSAGRYDRRAMNALSVIVQRVTKWLFARPSPFCRNIPTIHLRVEAVISQKDTTTVPATRFVVRGKINVRRKSMLPEVVCAKRLGQRKALSRVRHRLRMRVSFDSLGSLLFICPLIPLRAQRHSLRGAQVFSAIMPGINALKGSVRGWTNKTELLDN